MTKKQQNQKKSKIRAGSAGSCKPGQKRRDQKLHGVKRRRKLSRRNILRGTKTAWIFYCNKNRSKVLAANPQLSFGDVCKELAPQWKAMSAEEKQPYIDLHLQDKKRFLEQSANLTDEQKKALKQDKKQKREVKKNKPKPGLSPYMFFVINKRQEVVKEAPEANFQYIGKILGTKWNEMTEEEKAPFTEMSKKDKLRYREELSKYEDERKKAAALKKDSKKTSVAKPSETESTETSSLDTDTQ